MALPTLSSDDQKKLAHTIRESVKIMNEVKMLSDGIKDVKRSVAKELDIPLRDLNRACRLAFKKQEDANAVEEAKGELDTAEEILDIAKI